MHDEKYGDAVRRLRAGGGPAFPLPRGGGFETPHDVAGMTLRDWFATHAPREIPEWYEGPVLPRPKRPAIPEELKPYEQRVAGWADTGEPGDLAVYLPGDLRTVAEAYQQRWNEFGKAQHDHSQSQAVARYIAWRWIYADMMLAHRNVDLINDNSESGS